MSAEQLVAAAAAATGQIVDGDLAGWSEQVRRASSAAVVIAADMGRLLEALADPDLKMHVRKVTGVTQDKGRFIISYEPAITITFSGKATDYTEFRTGWIEEPHARQIARTARESIGQSCIFFQLNEKHEGASDAPAAGYRRLIHLEPVLTGSAKARPAPTQSRPVEEPPAGVSFAEAAAVVQHAPAPSPPAEQAPAAPQPGPVPPLPTLSPGPFGKTIAVIDGADADNVTPLDMIPGSWEAFMAEWQALGGDGQAVVRNGNKAAKSAGLASVPVVHRPATAGDIRLLAEFHAAALAGAAS